MEAGYQLLQFMALAYDIEAVAAADHHTSCLQAEQLRGSIEQLEQAVAELPQLQHQHQHLEDVWQQVNELMAATSDAAAVQQHLRELQQRAEQLEQARASCASLQRELQAVPEVQQELQDLQVWQAWALLLGCVDLLACVTLLHLRLP